MFTGRWPHELSAGAFTPLDRTYPTLAEYLGSHGYATAGFVANLWYCPSGTGLARGFTRYEDHALSVKRLKIAKLLNLCFDSAVWLGGTVSEHLGLDLLTPAARLMFGRQTPDSPASRGRVEGSREPVNTPDPVNFVNLSNFNDAHKNKNAAQLNRQFLDWLSSVPDPRRPFFAFLNYIDAHDSYVVPEGFAWRFGEKPKSRKDYQVISNWVSAADQRKLSQREVNLGRDAYDNCIVYLDDQLGKLIDELSLRGVLDETLVIITADHGEGLGEHDIFGHGWSLYDAEIRVPLLILLPKRMRANGVVNEDVTPRDLPATVVDVLGGSPDSPFTGRSLARFWHKSPGSAPPDTSEEVLSELGDPPVLNQNPGDQTHIAIAPGPILSVAVGDYIYIRNERDNREELYDVRLDHEEQRNLANVEAMQEVLEVLRMRLRSLAGPTHANMLIQ